MAVFLAVGLVGTNVVFSNPIARERGILGGPSGQIEVPAPEESHTALAALSVVNPQQGIPDEFMGVLDDNLEGPFAASLREGAQPVGIFSARGGVIVYKVKQGETLSQIAADFGISVPTITAANPKIRANSLQVGQELAILPVSGVTYEVKGGETLESVADLFNVPVARIQEFNRSVDFAGFQAGTSLVIPGATSRIAGGLRSSLPDLRGYFSEPTQGFNWGRLHNYNAVDIANACGTPVVAAAEGLVVDGAAEGWNGGYGGFLLIEHPNETKTRYSHLGEIFAGIGDYVKQNQLIGAMGNTGNVHGPTGCHLHFEIDGAQNPFVKY